MNNYTPIIKQYLDIKNNYKDAFLFFRMGDFYELFFTDAIEISKLLALTLTNKGECNGQKIPMAGFPCNSLNNYIIKLTKLNKKVAVCEQISNTKIDGLIERKVVFVSTPGTLVLENYLKDEKNNYIIYIKQLDDLFFISGLDLSSGNLFTRIFIGKNQLIDGLNKIEPAEILIEKNITCYDYLNNNFYIQIINNSKLNFDSSIKILKNLFGNKFFDNTELLFYKELVVSTATLLSYIISFKNNKLKNITSIDFINISNILKIDHTSIKNLEIFQNLSGGDTNTLFKTIDFTETPMGKRLLKRWLNTPLLLKNVLNERIKSVSILKENNNYKKFEEYLVKILDMERLIGRFENNSYKPIDLKRLQNTFNVIPKIHNILEEIKKNELLKNINNNLINFNKLENLIEKAISDNPSQNLKLGCTIIKDGFDKIIDNYRNIIKNTNEYILECQKNERLKTKINDLIINFGERSGYYIELKNNINVKLPTDYLKIKTLSNKSKYISNVTNLIEKTIKNAYNKLFYRESKIYKVIVYLIKRIINKLQNIAENLAQLDVLVSFAKKSNLYNWIAPEFTEKFNIEILNGRHPVIEHNLNLNFVPNDLILNEDKKMLIITGANMGGKSTYMRQNAIIILLAYIGSHVPATRAIIGQIEKIFTRIGSGDDLANAMSTFMLEIKEISFILNQVNKNSIVIIDEIGRGTGYLEGRALAFAILKELIIKEAFVLVSTHFYDLSIISKKYKQVSNIFFKVIDFGENLVFVYKFETGVTKSSFSIKIAKMAGLPNHVIENANKELSYLKKFDYILSSKIIKFFKNINTKNLSQDEIIRRIILFKNFLFKKKYLCRN